VCINVYQYVSVCYVQNQDGHSHEAELVVLLPLTVALYPLPLSLAVPVAPLDEEQVVRHLFTLGEIAQLCPERTPKRAFMLVQSLIATPTITGATTGDHMTELIIVIVL